MNYENFEKIEEFRELYNAIPNHLQSSDINEFYYTTKEN